MSELDNTSRYNYSTLYLDKKNGESFYAQRRKAGRNKTGIKAQASQD